jgi:hypothetical protein
MGVGWYVSRGGAVLGPFTWERTLEMAREGWIAPEDLVCRPGSDEWVSAASVPAFFESSAAAETQRVTIPVVDAEPPAQPAPQTEPVVLAPVPDTAPRKRRVPVVVRTLVIVAVSMAAFFAVFWYGPDALTALSGLGTSMIADVIAPRGEYRPSRLADVIDTKTYGRVPGNRLVVALADGTTRADADRVAASLGGSVVGDLGDLGFYVIDFKNADEAGLTAALKTASAQKGVLVAFPDQALKAASRTFYGVRCNMYDGAVYGDGQDWPQQMTGAQTAADIVRSSDLKLSPVKASIIEVNDFYQSGEFGGPVRWTFDTDAATTERPPRKKGLGTNGHAADVGGLFAGDPGNGGITGMASVLGPSLTVEGRSLASPAYSLDSGVGENAALHDIEFASAAQSALKDAVAGGARVINCSWGSAVNPPDPATVAGFKRLFEKLNQTNPGVVIICAGRNNEKAPGTDWPAGISAPNVITVANIDENGRPGGGTALKRDNYDVTIGAPGTDIVSGLDPQTGQPYVGTGNSLGAPQVAGTAAMMLALDPSLTGAQLKDIIARNAKKTVPTADGKTAKLGPGFGAGCLSADGAVREVADAMRKKQGLGPVDPPAPHSVVKRTEGSGASTLVDLRAVTQGNSYKGSFKDTEHVMASVSDIATDGAVVEAVVAGPGALSGSPLRQETKVPLQLGWVAKLQGKVMVVHVSRSDSGACWRVRFGPDVKPDEPDLQDELKRKADDWGKRLGALSLKVPSLKVPELTTKIDPVGTWTSTVPGAGSTLTYTSLDGTTGESKGDLVIEIQRVAGDKAYGRLRLLGSKSRALSVPPQPPVPPGQIAPPMVPTEGFTLPAGWQTCVWTVSGNRLKLVELGVEQPTPGASVGAGFSLFFDWDTARSVIPAWFEFTIDGDRLTLEATFSDPPGTASYDLSRQR